MNTDKRMKQYQLNQIETASPEQILLMLYDGAIRFTRQAIEGVETDNQEQRRYGISKTMAIITEFSNSLNREIGGHIAEDLDALYDYMIRQLSTANLKNDLEALKVVEKLLVDLRQTWGEAVEVNKKELAAKQSEAGDTEQTAQQSQGQGKTYTNPYGSGAGKPANYTPLSVSS